MALQGTKALEKWCQIVTEGYEGVRILNMSTSWRSGLGFCAIIHHFRPDLLDFHALDPDDGLKNNQLAFEVAEQHLGIPALLDPEDMVQCELLDRLSILTYLSQFYQVFNGATSANANKPKKSPASVLSSSEHSSPSKSAMPVIVGKRNEPCKICGKAVFILERLNVSGRLLHRTCFKCARCSTQLNVLNYYETENGEYCCDICPDEEKSMVETVEANKKAVEEHLETKKEETSNDVDNGTDLNVDNQNDPSEDNSLDNSHSPGQEKDINDNAKGLDPQSETENPFEEKIAVQNVPDSSSVVESSSDVESLVEATDSNANQENDKCKSTQEDVVLEPQDSEQDIGDDTGVQKSEEISENCVTPGDDDPTTIVNAIQDAHEEVNEDPAIKHEQVEVVITKNERDEVDDNSAQECHQQTYPSSKNPFGDDDDDAEDENEQDEVSEITEKKQLNDAQNIKVKKESTNPFGSDFDDSSDEDNQAQPPPPSATSKGTPLTGPPKPPRVSLNPFGSDFEDDEDDLNVSKSSLSSYKTPASPSPSSGTIRSRKKRQAPQPPGQNNPTASPRASLHPVPMPRHHVRSSSPTLSVSSCGSQSKPLAPRRPPPPAPLDSQKYRKDLDNQNRKSQILNDPSSSETSSLMSSSQLSMATASSSFQLTPLSPDKASEGQWKKKKGPAPPRPIPQKRQVKKLPRKAVNTELYDIEVKQQELERQGVKLEKTIREVCEKNDRERMEKGLDNNDRDSLGPEVEDLIVQLFDLVNEKNDLFRRQTELMYMKKDHRLEEEHADIEHQIRVLMAKTESQRTDEDKVKEEKLIARLMEIVAQRNEIVDCLEMDRLREMEEDESFELHLGEYAAIKPSNEEKKKKKKKEKEKKKKKKDKNYDADKDIDTSEFPAISPKPSPSKVPSDKDKTKKLKKKIIATLTTKKT